MKRVFVFIAILFILSCGLFYKVIDGKSMLYGTDWLSGTIFQHEYVADWLKNNHILPLWDSNIFGGMPTLGALWGDFFYPTIILRMIMPVYLVWTWKFILHIFIAGLFVFLYLRMRGNKDSISFIGSLMYMFAGFVVSPVFGGHDGRVMTMSLFPAYLYFFEMGFRKKSPFFYSLSGLFAGLALLTVHIQIVYYGVVFVAIYSVYLYFKYRGLSWRDGVPLYVAFVISFIISIFSTIVGFGLFAIFYIVWILYREKTFKWDILHPLYGVVVFAVFMGLISAVQFLPAFDYLSYASRGQERGYEYATSWSMPVSETIDLVNPEIHGISIEGSKYTGKNPFKLHTRYMGILPIILLLAMFIKRDFTGDKKFFIASLFIVFLIAIGGATPFFRIPYYFLPKFKLFRAPDLIFFLFTFITIVLSVESIERIDKKTLMYAAGVVGIVIILSMLFVHRPANVSGIFYKYAIKGIILTGLFYALITAYLSKREDWYLWIIGGLIVMDLFSVDLRFIKSVSPPTEYFAKDGIVEYLEKDIKDMPFRVVSGVNLYSSDDYFTYYSIPIAGGNHPNPMARYQKYCGLQGVIFNPSYIFMNKEKMSNIGIKYIIGANMELVKKDPRYANFVNNWYSIFPDSLFPMIYSYQQKGIFMNTKAKPYIYVSPKTVVKDSSFALSNAFYTADILEKGNETESNGRVKILNMNPNYLKCEVNLDSDGYVVRQENYYKNWHVKIDGQEGELIPVNYINQGVYVKKGNHVVEFYYKERLLPLGVVITLLSVLFIIALFFIERRRIESV